MKKKFAFILMGEHYTPEEHQVCFETGKQLTYIYTVNCFEEAEKLVVRLAEEGFGAIELCGAFGPERTRKLDEMTGRRLAIGYVVHDPELDERFSLFFGK